MSIGLGVIIASVGKMKKMHKITHRFFLYSLEESPCGIYRSVSLS